MHLQLTAEQKAFRTEIKTFAETVVANEIPQMENHQFPFKSLSFMAEKGYMGIPIHAEFGGMNKDFISYIIAIHELSKVSAAIGVILSVHTSVGTNPIYYFGNDTQRNKYLPKLASGKFLGAFALTEAGAGSDAARLKLKATKQGARYILNGHKQFITNGLEADTFITFARTSEQTGAKGISAFVIEKTAPGLSIGKSEKKMGLHGTSTVTLNFDHCKVSEKQLLGEKGAGFTIAMANLNTGRIGIAAQALGIADGALEYSRNFVENIRKDQATLFTLANMATKVAAARLLVYQAAAMIELGLPCIKEVSMAKLFATKTAREVAIDAVQLLGKDGYSTNHPVERFFRDAKVTEIYEGTSEIQRIVISKQVLK